MSDASKVEMEGLTTVCKETIIFRQRFETVHTTSRIYWIARPVTNGTTTPDLLLATGVVDMFTQHKHMMKILLGGQTAELV